MASNVEQKPRNANESSPHLLELREQLAGLPIELLLEIASHLDDDSTQAHGGFEARSSTTTAYLHILMTSSRHFRSVVRPIFWSEVLVSSQRRWLKLSSLFKGNKYRKSAPVLDPALVHTLDLELDRPGDDYGGLDDNNFTQIAETLTHLKHIRVRVGADTRLSRTLPPGVETYIEALSRFAIRGRITSFSLLNNTPQYMSHALSAVHPFQSLQNLLLDSMTPSLAPGPPATFALPNLQSFALRNSSELVVSAESHFSFLLGCSHLTSLSLVGSPLDVDFVIEILEAHAERLQSLELVTAESMACFSRFHLNMHSELGLRSVETGYYVPIAELENDRRAGNDAARICRELRHLTLGGPFCVSAQIFKTLSEKDREPLQSLSLCNAAPLRATRPDSDVNAKRERELVEEHPSGISPDDVIAAIDGGFHVNRLQLKGLGHEWNTSTSDKAARAREICESRGIAVTS